MDGVRSLAKAGVHVLSKYFQFLLCAGLGAEAFLNCRPEALGISPWGMGGPTLQGMEALLPSLPHPLLPPFELLGTWERQGQAI